MSVNFVAFLIGLAGVPIALLLCGHRLRRRPRRVQIVFWWAIVGHCVAGVLAITFAMLPPEAWTASETARGLAGYWGLLLIPGLSAVVALMLPTSRTAPRPVSGQPGRS